jgi:hypothetical protein
MKRIFKYTAFILFSIILLTIIIDKNYFKVLWQQYKVMGQVPTLGYNYQLPVITLSATSTPTTGFNVSTSGALYHLLTWSITGGTVSACQLSIDSSPNNSTWTVGGIIAAQTCTSNGFFNTTSGGVIVPSYIRVNLSTFTVATGTPSIVITVTGYSVFPSLISSTIDVRNFITNIGNVNADLAPAFLAACNSAPAQGGVIDARGVPTPIFWDSNPFSGTNCTNSAAVSILLPPGAICYSVPIYTPTGAVIDFIGAVTNAPGQGGTTFVPNNTGGVDSALCPNGNLHPQFPQVNNASIGGLLVTSWIGGTNGAITISCATSTSGNCGATLSNTTITINTTGGVAFPSNWVVGSKVFISGTGNGKLDGQATIATLNNGTGVATFTTANTVGASVPNILTGGPNITISYDNANVGIFDGSLDQANFPGGGVTNGYQKCINNSFGGHWRDVVFTGNSIPNFVAYYTCSKQELSYIEHGNFLHFSLFGLVRDGEFNVSGNAGPAHAMEDKLIFDPGTGAQNQSITQVSTGNFTGFTITAGSSVLYNYATMTIPALTATPISGSTVFINNTGTGADGLYFQVTDSTSGLAGCNNPSTTFLCILTPNVAAHAAVNVGQVTLLTGGEMFEGFQIQHTNIGNAAVVAGLWASGDITFTAGRSGSGAGLNQLYVSEWIGSVKNGTFLVRDHCEDQFSDCFQVGMGNNTIASWGCLTCEAGSTPLSSLQFSNGSTLQNLDYGGGAGAVGPGAGINIPAIVRFGKFAFGNSVANLCNVFAKNVFADIRNNYFYKSGASSANPELNCTGSYSQGTQFTPACYLTGATPACGAATSGVSQIAAGSTTVTISTTAITSNSVIDIGITNANTGGLTCGAETNPTSLLPYVSAVTTGVSFTITSVTPVTGTACYTWTFVN